MGTISDKLTYLNTTKSQLKDMINYGLDDNSKITSSTTFRKYVTSIFNAFLEALRTPDTLFTNLPKKSGTGANITLNDTANAPMRITLGSRALEQETTTGKNKITFDNLTDETRIGVASTFNNSEFKLNGTTNASGQLITQQALGVTLPAGTYKVSYKIASGNYSNIGGGNDIALYLRKSGTVTSIANITFYQIQQFGGTNQRTGIEFTLTETTSIDFYAYCNASGIVLNNVVIQAQIEAGNVMTDYEPYTGGIPAPNPSYPQDIHTISGSNTIKVCGRNIIGSLVNYRADVDTTTGVVTKSDTGLGRFFDLPLEVDNVVVSFTASDTNRMVALQYDSDGTYLGRIVPPTAPTAGSNWNYHFDLSNSYKSILYISNQSYNNNTNFQIEYGTTASPYEAPTLETKDINLGDIEYCKIGDYEDKFIRDEDGTWYLKQEIGKYVFNGNEGWETNVYGTNSWTLDNVIRTNYDTSKIQIMSNIFKGTSNDNRATSGDNIIYTYSNSGIIIRNTNLTTLAEVQNATINNYAYYVLATPEYTPITGTLAEQLENVYQKMLSQKGQTNISQVNDDLSFNLSVSALENLEV